MKICHILSADPKNEIGGTPMAARSIHDYIKSHKEMASVIKHGKGPGIIKTIFYPIFNALSLINSDYDIIHIHDPQGYFYTLFPRFLRKKIIYTSHGETTAYCNEAVRLLIQNKGKACNKNTGKAYQESRYGCSCFKLCKEFNNQVLWH